MRYVVNGVDAGGKHKRAVVEAADEPAARAMVQGVGLTVTSIERAGNGHSESTSHHVTVSDHHPDGHGTTHAATPGHITHVPDYPGLHIGAWVIRMFGIGAAALGLASLYPVVQSLRYARQQQGGLSPSDISSVENVALVSFTLFGTCALLWIVAAVAIAVRDIARNSFHK